MEHRGSSEYGQLQSRDFSTQNPVSVEVQTAAWSALGLHGDSQ
jgi:hypothetical protein